MNCPNCGKDEVSVVDTVHNTEAEETYRKKKCNACGYIFYTTEFEVTYDRILKNEWNRFYRK